MNHSFVGIEEQRSWRDLRQLEQTSAVVRWVGAEEAATAPETLVACGVWVCRDPSAAALLRQRAAAGRASLLVARFEAKDMGPLVGAPVKIQVCPGESTALVWEDGQNFKVPSVTVIETAIAEGHWARSAAGTTVFAYRPHTQAGLIVLCTATITGVALGADPAQQRALLERVMLALTRQTSQRIDADVANRAPTVCATAAEYLEHHGPEGAVVLLAALDAPDGRVNEAMLAAIGCRLPTDRVASLLAALPGASSRDIEQALRAAGWGAHLRSLARRRSEAS